jgi:hypothetical protein
MRRLRTRLSWWLSRRNECRSKDVLSDLSQTGILIPRVGVPFFSAQEMAETPGAAD